MFVKRIVRSLPPLLLALTLVSGPARAQETGRTLVLPPRTLGVSDTTASVYAAILAGELENRGVAVVPEGELPADLARGAGACGDSACATALARSLGADRVVFGSLSRLGDKVIVRVRAVTAGHPELSYSDQLTSTTEDDLDVVAKRIAETIASGRINSGHATLSTITNQETLTPRRRASRSGAGLRAGFLFPDGDSYGGADQLAGFRLTFRYEASNIFIESTPVIGFMWGDGNFEWTVLDVHAGRMFGTGDWSPYFVGGLGVHAAHIERRREVITDPYGYTYTESQSEGATLLAADAGVGIMMLRTYDFSLVLDLRYHALFSEFEKAGGGGAHGITLSIGTTH